ncbi:hypothetical protein C7974DRAFT_392442 [Boeremia exigua]|uniref:uncharacterized protein n=1 Tax=Boeremia exigua TaxID=749465 RepID=UPI001E8D6317|nr:uncharacterized protein C7974DRAFT_392442 [Boeremia exigua]KAH6633272.1 hypothetical protein C7974DRAFT_392442 [Boeremia exigua]
MPRGTELPHGVPPPDEDMVFYPAPVPRMLNLPKRLSQLPASDVAARRRTQVLDQIEAENRKSAPWLTSPDPPKNRKSRQSVAGLPAALRASAFFDQQGPAQEFEVKGESAEDTLDSILEASARAPVSAFTDHTFGGGYSPEHKRKSTKMSLMDPVVVEPTKRRSSFNILDTDTNSSGKKLNKLKKRNSSADMNILIARAAESRMSLGADLDDPDQHARGPNDPDARGPNDPDTASRHSSDDDHKSEDEREKDAEFEEEPLDDEEPQYFGPPTTLLAELQLRKAKQKERNMNYVTMVEEGKITSHRTLLDLNDDAEKEHQRRLKKKVQLAWEAQEDDSDDDVPLGVLYKQPQRREIDYPIGLIAQRELEDHEPLSRRRERITGIPNSRRAPAPGPYDSQTTLEVPRVATPARVRGRRAHGRDPRRAHAPPQGQADARSRAGRRRAQLGVDDSTKDPKDPPAAPADPDEETLGQRRARLKAEAEARGDPPAAAIPPPLRSKMSLADVLAANPHDASNQARKVSDQQLLAHLPPGSLLRQNALAEEKRRVARLNQNMRSSSYNGPADPLVRGVGDANTKDDEDIPLAHRIQAYKDKMAGVGGVGESHARAQSMLFNPALNASQSSMMMPGGMPGMQGAMPGLQPTMQPTMMQSQMHPGLGPRQSSMPMQMSMMQQGPQMNVVGGMPMMAPMNMGQSMNMGQGMNMPMQNMGMGMQGMGQGMNMSPGMSMQNMNMGMSMGPGMGMNMGMQRGMPGQPMPMGMPMGMDMLPMNGQQRSNIEGWMRGIR